KPEVTGEPVRQVEPERSCAADETHDARPLHAGRPFEGNVCLAAFDNRPAQHVSHRSACFLHRVPLVIIITSARAGVNPGRSAAARLSACAGREVPLAGPGGGAARRAPARLIPTAATHAGQPSASLPPRPRAPGTTPRNGSYGIRPLSKATGPLAGPCPAS